MSDNELDADAELLALAGDSDGESAKEATRSPTPKKSRARAPPKKTTKPARRGKAARDVSDEEDEISAAESLGSGAMSESEEEGEAPGLPVEQEGPMYPLDGKFLSEKDKAEIMAMPELQRETVLADRAAEMQRRKEDLALRQLRENRLKVEAQADAIKKRKAPEIDDTPRKANRTKMTKTNEKLENYKKAREQRTEQRKRNEDRKTGDRDSPAKNDAEESDKDADGEEDVEWDEPASRAPAKNEAQPEMRDYERIRVGRTNFARVCFWPGFEDAIKGCFTRVCIGLDKATSQNTYRMCQIKGFTIGRPYSLDLPGSNPVLTDQYAIVTQGKQEKEWPFSACSDSKFTDREYDRYKSQLSQDSVRPPVLSFLQSKCAAIHALIEKPWPDEDINYRLRRAAAVGTSTSERDRLQKERLAAEAKYDEAAIAKIDAQLASLEQRLPAPPKPAPNKEMTQQEKLAARNKANRKANIDNIRKAQIADRAKEKKLAEALARGDVGVANTHARVKTVPKTIYKAEEMVSSAKAEGDDLDAALFGSEVTTRESTPVPAVPAKKTEPSKLARSGLGVGIMGRKKKDEDLMAAMDLGIEIDI